jgi:hypothetical protein
VKPALAFVAVLLAAASAHAQSKTFDRTVSLTPTGAVTLEAHNGAIDVRTWQRPEVQIHVQIDAASAMPQDVRRFNETTVDVTSTRDSVSIKTVYPDTIWSWVSSSPTLHYTINAPAGARWTIRAHNARTDVRDLHAALTVDTHNGDLHAVNLAGPLEVSAHNATTSVDFASFQGATVTVHNGTSELTLPRASRFDLRVDTHNGGLESDFPVMIRTASRRSGDVDGTVNGGGAAMRFEAHNGTLRLKAK